MGLSASLRSPSIRLKILLGFLSVIFFADLAGVIAVWNLAQVNVAASEVAGQSLPRVKLAQETQIVFHRLRIDQYRTMLADEVPDRQAAEAAVASALESANKLMENMKEVSVTPERQARFKALDANWNDYLQGNQKAMMLTGEFGLKAMGGDYEKLFNTLKKNIGDIIAAEGKAADASAASAQKTYSQARLTLVGVLLLANVLGLVLALWLSHRIAEPLNRAMHSAKAVSQGD